MARKLKGPLATVAKPIPECTKSSLAEGPQCLVVAMLRKEMGVNSWAAFAGSQENAFVDGDFSVLESETAGCAENAAVWRDQRCGHSPPHDR